MYISKKCQNRPIFGQKVISFRAQKITESNNSELQNQYWNSFKELWSSISELDALIGTMLPRIGVFCVMVHWYLWCQPAKASEVLI